MIRPSFAKAMSSFEDDEMTWKDLIIEILCYNSISSFIRKVGRFIVRVVRWLPVLWEQEDWDYSYIYDLLIMKMKELRKDMSKDYWHNQREVQQSIKQIDVCLARLDRYLNWTNYYEYPMEDLYYEPTKDGCLRMCYASEKNEKQRLGAIEFEEKNFNKFWEDFIKWHRGWWT